MQITRESEAELIELLRRHPNDVRGHNNYGVLLLNQGRIDRAILHFRETLRLKPNYRQARINLDNALRQKKPTRPVRKGLPQQP
jgi:Tfp pilus assembly protein PilF